jgi:protein TonB
MQTMRFAEGYHAPARLRPSTVGLTLLTTGFFVSGLFFLNPKVVTQRIKDFTATSIPAEQPKPIPTPKPVEHKQTPQQKSLYVPPTHPTVTPLDPPVVDFGKVPTISEPPTGGTGTFVEPVKTTPLPVIVGPVVDPRYASSFQPAYPANEIRGGNAGRVTVKVLIGVDGRVKDIEKISAASDSFWEATRRQALAKWRFKPATRDGEPYETWKTMNVSFVLNQEQ